MPSFVEMGCSLIAFQIGLPPNALKRGTEIRIQSLSINITDNIYNHDLISSLEISFDDLVFLFSTPIDQVFHLFHREYLMECSNL